MEPNTHSKAAGQLVNTVSQLSLLVLAAAGWCIMKPEEVGADPPHPNEELSADPDL